METIKVNMTPCEDIKTIHASQNDNEAREWGFELHNNGEKIDSSSISDQLVFKAYEGGTEQILPTNGSTPTTSPFKGDIKYPQGLLSDQEFLYRESPTEEDGLAKITDIKGNTIVWNQLVRNGNFVDTSYWNGNGTKTVSNNELTYTKPARWNSLSNSQLINLVSGHKYLAMFEAYCENDTMSIFWQTGIGTGEAVYTIPSGASWKKYSLILTSAQTTASGRVLGFDNNSAQETIFHLRNYMFIDLTMMGLDSMTLDEVKEWLNAYYPLPYYAYNQGTLLSFNGNGIKTVGFNQWDGETESGYIYNGVTYASNDYWRTKNYIHVIPNETYYFNVPSTQGQIALYDANKVYVSSVNSMGGSTHLVTIPSGCYFARFYQPISSDSSTVCVNISSSRNGQYEPYTSSTLSLPISTYFTNGMKSAGSVYDELTETKAINRLIKTVVDGTNKTASYYGVYQTHQLFYVDLFATTYADFSNMANLISNHYSTSTSVEMSDKYIRYQAVENQPNIGRIYWNDDRYTSASAMNTALQSDPLEIVSLAQSETVEAFSVASLVTENAEIPLSNNDGVLIGKCTEQLSSESGFFDAKIKLADEDGECYSNKIQLHIERSPQ